MVLGRSIIIQMWHSCHALMLPLSYPRSSCFGIRRSVKEVQVVAGQINVGQGDVALPVLTLTGWVVHGRIRGILIAVIEVQVQPASPVFRYQLRS